MNHSITRIAQTLQACAVICLIAACGGGGSPATTNVTVGVTASTVAAGEAFVFAMGNQNITVTQNAVRTNFPNAIATGENYVVTQVSGPRTCTLSSNSSGTATATVEVIATCGAASGGTTSPPPPPSTPPPASATSGYSGTVNFDVALPTFGYVGAATLGYSYIGEFPDIKYYGLTSGSLSATFSFPAQNCAPVSATVALKTFVRSSPSLVDFDKSNTLLLWTTEAGAGFANTHSFDLEIAQGQSVSTTCKDQNGNDVPTTLNIGGSQLGQAGLCVGSPVASWTNANQLSGDHACAAEFVNRVNWTLTRNP